ncbi:hypothetical protein JTB14_003842 [Gonioctena quinquepunctata]|nr:hypothetical protein JTB14_003842 [Gonioctena quinquepunctata]
MALLIPDEIQEKLICHTCNKFLSFQPIKVYPNRKIKCGRCSEKEDAGVVSLFNLLAKQGLFKCVNKFDGCRTLLIYSQVPEHERECATKSYMCPNCPDSTKVPTYLMISHFKEKHSNCYLDTSYFSIDISESLEVSKFFLYRHQDNLFIIAYTFYASTEYFTLSVMFLGNSKDAENINQRFTLSAGKNFKIHTREKPCVALDLFNVGGFKIDKTDIPEKFKMIYITFKIDMLILRALYKYQLE